MSYGMQKVKIKTKITDENRIKELGKIILEFADKHGVEFMCGYNDNNELIAQYQVEGRTSAYCKGMVTEMNKLLKDTYNCKTEVLMYMY